VTSAKQLASGTIEHETEPLAAEIGGLKAALTTAEGAKAALQTALDAVKAELAMLATPVKVALPTARLGGKALAKRGTSVAVTGVAGSPVEVRLAIGERAARKLELRSSVLASGKATLSADGKASVALEPGKSARKALGKLKRPLAITVTARSGDRIASTTGTVTR
jgi:hypothetical protein